MKYKNANPTARCIVCGGKFCPSRIRGLLECEECKFTTADFSFSRDRLRKLLCRYGFVIREIAREGVYRSVDTMAYIMLCLKSEHPRIYAQLRKMGLLNWNIDVDLRDTFLLWQTRGREAGF